MKKVCVTVFLLSCTCLLRAGDDSREVYPCSFVGHSPAGTVSGSCTTQSLPDDASLSRWKLTLTFDERSVAAARTLKKDRFFDLVRTQCLENGSFAAVLSLWGDLAITPSDADYLMGNRACAPVAQTVPNVISISEISGTPFTLEFLFDQRRVDFNQTSSVPTIQWLRGYMTSFRLLSGNPPR